MKCELRHTASLMATIGLTHSQSSHRVYSTLHHWMSSFTLQFQMLSVTDGWSRV